MRTGGSSSFDTMRALQLLPPRRRAAVFEQAGNAMHTNMVGIGMLCGLMIVSAAQPVPARKREFGSIASGSCLGYESCTHLRESVNKYCVKERRDSH